jgi:hypothetical protein
MTFRLNRKNSSFWKMILLGIAIPLFLLPFIHYHPEATHSHDLNGEHQHEGRYHSATLEAYAHLVNGHFSNNELDNHFHNSHSSEDYDDSDSETFALAKSGKSFKQELVLKQIRHSQPFGISKPLVSASLDSEATFIKLRSNKRSHSSRSPPSFLL